MGIYHVVLTPFRKIGLGMRIDTICLNFQHFFMASWQHYIKYEAIQCSAMTRLSSPVLGKWLQMFRGWCALMKVYLFLMPITIA